ncbi:MAG: ribosome biogenesis GTPase YlqF [Cyanophyceae cyanobacterium]
MPSSLIQWYPGHIARATRQLQQQLQRVEVVLEILDARIPLSSQHPDLSDWLGNKARLRVLNRIDQVTDQRVQQWQAWFQAQGIRIYPIDGRSGQGIPRLKHAAIEAGSYVNRKRATRGLKPRAIRAAVVGFPNVGKSAILNRLLGKRVAASAARPGVTRQLQWVRIGTDLDLLDAPGIIPPLLNDQVAAMKLAICDDIGGGAYAPEAAAAALLEWIPAPVRLERYNLDDSRLDAPSPRQQDAAHPRWETGEQWLYHLAEDRYQGDQNRTAQQILKDFRKGSLGLIGLEDPPALSLATMELEHPDQETIPE